MGTVSVFALCVLIISSSMLACMAGEPVQRYCGRKLTEKVQQVCNNCLHGEGSGGMMKRHAYRSEVMHRRRRTVNALIPICCINPCPVSAMEDFCCDDNERIQYEESKKFLDF